MSGELVIFIVGLIIWFVFSILGKVLKSGQSPYVPPPPPPEQDRLRGELPPLPEQQQSWQQQQAAQGRQPQQQVSPLGQALRDIMQEAGLGPPSQHPEQPVASEHTATWGEHQRTWSETVPTLSEATLIDTEQRRTASEATLTASEHRVVPSEHVLSPGEHVPGDAYSTSDRSPWADQAAKTGGGLGAAVVAELRRDPGSLARAIVLQEVLNPPVGLRPPDSERS